MIPLNDFFPCDCIAGNTATDQQSSQLGVFQTYSPELLIEMGQRCSQLLIETSPKQLRT
jgi:hypothetical protein